ncbi:conserved hypothetical protein [Candidatus Brocadia pituitae]|nr:conserved hypothetical protein [Candidatus Brocadia pituitae]
MAVASNLTATFSEAMDPITINSTTFTVNGVAGVVSLSADGLTATFNPNVDLANSTLYTATITTGAKDANNNAMAPISSGALPRLQRGQLVGSRILRLR